MPDKLRQRSWLLGFGVAIGVLSVWFVTLLAVLRAGSTISLVVAGVLHAMAAGSCFVAGHDAVHGVLVPSRAGNALLGRLLLLPGWHPASAWAHSHNVLHHGYTNLRGLDPVYPPYSPGEFQLLPAWRRAAERVFRTPIGVGLLYACTVWWPLEIAPSGAHLIGARKAGPYALDRALVLVFIAVVVGLHLAVGTRLTDIARPDTAAAVRIVLGVLWPFLVWMWMMGLVTYQQHTHPSTYWFDGRREWSIARSQLSSTVEQHWGGLVDVAFLEIGRHHAHHVDPRIPLYRLREAQHALRQHHGDLMPLLRLRWAEYIALWRSCQLYDYETHQWCRFDGTPATAPRILPTLPIRQDPA